MNLAASLPPRLTLCADQPSRESGADPASKTEKRRSAMNLSSAIRIALPAEFAVSGISREPYRPETEAPPPFALSWSLPRRLRPSATYRIRWRDGRSRSAPRAAVAVPTDSTRRIIFSILPSYDRNCQCNWFPHRRNRDGNSTRKLNVRVFTQPRSKTEVAPRERQVRSTLKSRYRQATPACPISAKAQSRCAPARCAGARAERLVADGEDGDSGVASINSRIVGVQRMIKNSRII